LGDVNGDGYANSTDALIVVSCDVGIDTTPFCPMNSAMSTLMGSSILLML